MKSLLKLAFILVVAVLGYNYFFGSVEEKEQSQEIVKKVKDVGRDAWGLLKSEKVKLEAGKYDGAANKVSDAVKSTGELLGKLSKTASDLNDSDAINRLAKLQYMQEKLEEELKGKNPDNYDEQQSDKIRTSLKNLLRETESLMRDMDKNKQ